MTSADDNAKKGKQRSLSAEIDRVEDGGVAVLIFDEGRTAVDIPVALLPEGADAGDHVRVTFTLDHDSRAKAGDRIAALQRKLEQRRGESAEQKDFKV